MFTDSAAVEQLTVTVSHRCETSGSQRYALSYHIMHGFYLPCHSIEYPAPSFHYIKRYSSPNLMRQNNDRSNHQRKSLLRQLKAYLENMCHLSVRIMQISPRSVILLCGDVKCYREHAEASV